MRLSSNEGRGWRGCQVVFSGERLNPSAVADKLARPRRHYTHSRVGRFRQSPGLRLHTVTEEFRKLPIDAYRMLGDSNPGLQLGSIPSGMPNVLQKAPG